MKKQLPILGLLFLFNAPLLAEEGQSVSELLLNTIIERSPYGRYQRGDRSPGAKSLRSDPRCSTPDFLNLQLLQKTPTEIRIPRPDEVLRDSIENARTRDLSLSISYFEDELIKLSATFMAQHSEDPLAKDREICVGSALFAAPNAISLGIGIMVFDPQLFFQIARNESANDWSMKAIVAHEFAHQLQYWFDEPFLSEAIGEKPKVRNLELQADCVAAALLSKLHDDFPVSSALSDAKIPFNEAVIGAFSSLGDFELESASHHGSAYERALMLNFGREAATSLKEKSEPISTSLKICRDKIQSMNKRFGEILWPLGSSLDTK